MTPTGKPHDALCSRGFLLVAVLVALISTLSMPAEMVPGDSGAARCETVSLLNTGSLAVPEQVANIPGVQQGQYFYKNGDRWYSKYGILNSLVYLPPLLVEKLWRGHLDYEASFPGRVLLLNLLNIAFTLATAAYLYKFASLYTPSLLVKTVFILAGFYSTFWWDHLRIQAFEAYQPMLLIGACYHFIRALREDGEVSGKHFFGTGLLLGLLWLSKASYILIAPLLATLFVFLEWKKGGIDQARLRRCGVFFGLPTFVCFCILLAVNALKFGSPFNNGYNQWTREQHMWTGNIFEGIAGFLFDPQFSIFITYPVLIIALFGLWKFIRRHGPDALAIYSVALLLLLVNSKFLNWRGLWSYGPRYMLPALAMMSLPAIGVFEIVISNIKKPWAVCAALAIVLVLGYSTWLQTNVNALKFYTCLFVKEKLSDPIKDPELDHYFNTRHFGLISADILASKHGKPLWFRDRIELLINNKPLSAKIDTLVASTTRSNYYFFPDDR